MVSGGLKILSLIVKAIASCVKVAKSYKAALFKCMKLFGKTSWKKNTFSNDNQNRLGLFLALMYSIAAHEFGIP